MNVKRMFVFLFLLVVLVIGSFTSEVVAQEGTEEPEMVRLFLHLGSHGIDERSHTEESSMVDVTTIVKDNPYLDGIVTGTYLDFQENYEWWTNAAHTNGVSIQWRSAGYNSWRGTNGFAQTGTPEQHNADFPAWLRMNCQLLEPGDGLSPVPDEASNWWEDQERGGVGADRERFNLFLQEAAIVARQILQECGKEEVELVYYDSPSVIKDVLTEETASLFDLVGTDNYSDRGQTTPEGIADAMQSELTQWVVGVHNNKPWGITTGVGVYMDETLDEASYAEAYARLLPTISETLPNLRVVTLWQFGNRGNDPLNRLYNYNGKFEARQQVLDAILVWAAQYSPL
jgi:hypothetical protein